MIIAQFVAAVIIGYLLGSIPFRLLVGKYSTRVDVRQYGSGKIGATNVLRTAGMKAAAMAVILDLLKGALAVIFAGLIFGNSYLIVGDIGLGTSVAQAAAGLAAIVGHNWSVFLKFHGGRGVATFLGGLAALCPAAALFGGGVLVLTAGLTRYASLGSIVGLVAAYAILVPLTILNNYPIEYLGYTFTGTILIIAMHRDNIIRLVSGKERKLGDKTDKTDLSPSVKSMG